MTGSNRAFAAAVEGVEVLREEDTRLEPSTAQGGGPFRGGIERVTDEVDAAVSALTALLEPLMMVFLGGTIGTILIAMCLPIFKIAEAVK